MENFKSGFVSVVGRPNTGKSTLINRIVQQKVAIVSNKPQTTRNRITAIYKDEQSQIIFIDTPGIHAPKNKLGGVMVKSAYSSMEDMDAIIFMVDASRDIIDRNITDALNNKKTPVILVINKIDLIKKENILSIIDKLTPLCLFDSVIPISAQNGDGVDILIETVKKLLPDGPEYFPDDMVTDQPERQIIAEIIREKALRHLSDEIPHGVAVEIEAVKSERGGEFNKVNAVIYVEKSSHKMIIIGKNGAMLKKIGTSARMDIERLLGGRVYLELWVRVKNDWRNSDYMIKNFGFNG